MSSDEPDIFNIAVDADDYAEAAAGDIPSAARTYQSEEDFEKIRASYVAKHDDGNLYQELITLVPALQSPGQGSVKLDKRLQLLVGYAVGELYYDQRYNDILDLLNRVEGVCLVDAKLQSSMKKWRRQCEAKCR